jgi:prepilin-type N-terminal cleavage/methylation domain-containing protein/prepilin-type processing-associated H-X9-DG protein
MWVCDLANSTLRVMKRGPRLPLNGPDRRCEPFRHTGVKLFCTRDRSPNLRDARLLQQNSARRAFNLLELLIVLAVTTILTSLLLPALAKLHENVNVVRCGNNLKQIGTGMFMYTDDWRGNMPPTVKLHSNPDLPIQPQELMASYHKEEHASGASSSGGGSYMPVASTKNPYQGGFNPPLPEYLRGWDGLGLLHALEYCRAVDCYYCPSHKGDHPIERYSDEWQEPGDDSIYINYHYAGHIDWETRRRRMFKFSSTFIVASDGLRTVSDFNHGTGMNILFGDASVEYRSSALSIYHMLPEGEVPLAYQQELYTGIWQALDRINSAMPDGSDSGND